MAFDVRAMKTIQKTDAFFFMAAEILWLSSIVLWFGALSTIGEWISAHAGYDINKYAFADLRFTWVWFFGLMIPVIAGIAGWKIFQLHDKKSAWIVILHIHFWTALLSASLIAFQWSHELRGLFARIQ